jgi:hypothetical protein
MTIPIFGTGYHLTPDQTKETEKEQAKKSTSQVESGAILSKDSLEIPFEKQFSIQSEEAEAGRPFLPPLFRMRFAEDRQVEDLSRDYYQTLRNNLPPLLKDKLEKDEAQPSLEDRDPDLVALDSSLKFEANLLALADTLSVPSNDHEKVLLGAQQYIALPTLVQQEFLSYGANVLRFFDHYLDSIGPNDASYEILVNVSNQVKEALELLSLNRETTNSNP